MKIFAYSYADRPLDRAPDLAAWGTDIDRAYTDIGDRAALHQLLAACEAEPVGYVLVRRMEELGDSVAEIGDRLSRLQGLGVEVVAAETEDGATLEQFYTLQQHERSRRIRQGHARNRVRALPPPGKAPYGYRRGKDGYTVDRAAAPVVKDFFEQFLLYGSLRGAVRYIGRRYGKKISATTGRRWLVNPVYRGDLAYGNGEVVRDTHAAIIDREEAAQVDRLLRRNRRLPPRTASAPRSLAGLVSCGTCGCKMTVARVTQRGKNKEYSYLRPLECPQQPKCGSLPYEEVLHKTIAAVCRDLVRVVAGLPTVAMGEAKRSLQAEIAQKQQILDRLPGLVTEGVLDDSTAGWRSYQLKTEISALQTRLEQLPPVNLKEVAKAVSIPQFWFDLSESERRFYFREFVREAIVDRCDGDWEVRVKFIFDAFSG